MRATRSAGARAQGVPRPLVLTSPAFKAGQPMPRQYTADGRNESPPLSWSGVPPGSIHLVVTFQDDDEIVPLQSPFLHWAVYNIPPPVRQLAGGLPGVEVDIRNPAGEDRLKQFNERVEKLRAGK